MSTYSRAACGQSFIDIERMIHKIIAGFVERFGGQSDDYLGPAHEAYMRAYDKWDPERGAFTTLVWWCVVNELRNFVAKRSRQRARECRHSNEKHLEPVSPMRFDLRLFASELSDDAATVARLLCDEPVESAERMNGRARQRLSGKLRARLWEDLGWGMDRVTESFSEVREALR